MKELPSAWAKTNLGNLTEYVTSGSRDWSKYYAEAGVLFVRTQDINTNKLAEPSSIAKVCLPASVEGKRTLIRTGDLLITITGANVGRCAHVAAELPEAYVSQSVALVRLRDPSFGRFVHLQLLAPSDNSGKTSLEARAYGMGRPVLNLDNVRETPLLIPPRQEQQRITEKLDTVLARVDAVGTSLARVAHILKRFRRSVLAAAISGRLTEDWRLQLGTESDWSLTDVQSVAQVGTGSTPLRSNPAFFAPTGIPWITSAATGQDLVTSAVEYVTRAAITAHRLRVYPIGTLLVAMYGEGKTRGQVTELGISATVNQACAAVVVDETRMLRSFVKLALQAKYLEMRVLAEGGNQPNLNLAKVKAFPLPRPSRDEQAEIVRRVETLLAFANRLEARLLAAQTAAERMTPALLAKAFRGELVPQDPNDEPATELLRRLKADRPANKSQQGRKAAV